MLGDQEDAAAVSPRFILAAHTPPALPDYILKTLGKSWKERLNIRKKREKASSGPLPVAGMFVEDS